MTRRFCSVCDAPVEIEGEDHILHEAPDYMPETFRRSYGTQILCEPCAESIWERQQENR